MQSFKTVESIQNWISSKRREGLKIGFVPTMGALHHGHLSLIKRAKNECDLVVASVFVNPTQFNSLEDLEKYPRSLESDLRMLIMANCDAVFVPEVLTMYPSFPDKTNFVEVDLGLLEQVMEGAFRPGHFKGVLNVVYRLFDIVQPNKAYFGEKDFQQLAVIKKMVDELRLPIDIVPCETMREKNGLAMSSRNQRLSQNGIQNALIIAQTLNLAKSLSETKTPKEVMEIAAQQFENSSLSLEYLSIAEPVNLTELSDLWIPKSRCFIAAHCEGVRLIDNMELNA